MSDAQTATAPKPEGKAPPRTVVTAPVIGKPEATTPQAPGRPIRIMHPCQDIGELKLGGKLYAEVNNHWGFVAPHDHSLEDVLKPWYCWHIGPKMRERDIITITHQHHLFIVEMYVQKVDLATQSLIYKLLRCDDLSKLDTVTIGMEGCTIEYMGANGYTVRGPNGLSMSTGHKSPEDAQTWINDKKREMERLSRKPG